MVGLGRLELPTSPLSVVSRQCATVCDGVLQPTIYAASSAVGQCEDCLQFATDFETGVNQIVHQIFKTFPRSETP